MSIEIKNSLDNRRGTVGGGGAYRWGLHDLFGEVVSLENLFLAWREFRKGKRSKLDVQQFEFALEDNLFELHHELISHTYHHAQYTPFYVTDPKLRHIHKATVRDRVVHQAMFRILYPTFDRAFIFDSYSCRAGKGTHRGVGRLEAFARKVSQSNRRNIFALKCDIKKFFDSIDHDILFDLIEQKVQDQDMLFLIRIILNSFHKKEGKGLPLGNVTSQLFANIYLNELDHFVKCRLEIPYYIRYCDDFVIFANYFHDRESSLQGLSELISTIQDFLTERLTLTLHPNKVIIRTYRQGIDFLGYVVRPYCRTLRTKTKKRILKNINSQSKPQSIQSYLGVLKHCGGWKIRKAIAKALI